MVLICVLSSLFAVGLVCLIGAYLVKNDDCYNVHESLNEELNGIQKAGEDGERKAQKMLFDLLSEGEFLLSNLLIPSQDGSQNEIDCVLVSRKGIFCIEVKSWLGKIMGGNTDISWRQEYRKHRRQSKLHRNPFKQNEIHCNAIDKLLKHKYPIFNIILFINKDKLKYVQSRNSFTRKTFKQGYDLLGNKLSLEDIEKIKTDLTPFVATTNELILYKKNIRERFSDI